MSSTKREKRRLSEDEAFAFVISRGRQIRRHERLTQVGSSVLALALVGGGMSFAFSGNRSPEVRPAAGGVFETPTPTPEVSLSEIPSLLPTSPVVPSATPTTEPNCKNSFDSSCGTFRWEKSPHENRPTEFTKFGWAMVESEGSMRNGRGYVQVLLRARDDAIYASRLTIDWGDGTAPTIESNVDRSSCKTGYGAWTPPEYRFGNVVSHGGDPAHYYPEPGTYVATVKYETFSVDPVRDVCQAYDLWSDTTTRVLTIKVEDKQSPSPSPSSEATPPILE